MDADAATRVISEARTWIGTPYHHAARVKGAGCDCAMLLLAAFAAAGVIADFDPGPYPADWHMHRSEERYVEFIQRFADEYDWRAEPIAPADIAVWRYGRTFSHGGIVSQWPRVIHAFAPYRIVDETDVRGTVLEERPMRTFRLMGT